MDLNIPKTLSNRNNGYSKHFRDMTVIEEHVWKKNFFSNVFNNGYSKHFRDMTSGTKLKKMIEEHVWKKNFFSNAFE